MIIAVACEGNMVTEHFGHCETFHLFETQNGEIVKNVIMPNPGHKPGYLPNYLSDLGVNVIISGGMGSGAVEIFSEKNIEVITGAKGESRRLAMEYLKGKLKSTGSVCHDHNH